MKRALIAVSLTVGATALGAPAIITIQPQLVFESSNVLTMEIGGRTPGPGTPVDDGYDRLIFTSLATPQVTWGGTLSVALIHSFAPAAGDVFDLFDFDAARDAGAFATLTLPALNTGLLWNAASLYTDGSLRIALDPAITGRIWDGGGADNDWRTDANWNLDVEPLNNGTAALTFAGTARLAPSVDTAWNVASIAFDATAGAFTITGPQAITVGAGGITNNDDDPQTITAAVTLGASASIDAAVGGLSVSSVALGSHTLTVTGAGEVMLGGASGAGTVAKTGAGDLTVTGNLGSGGVSLLADAGIVTVTTSQTLAALTIGDSATVTFGAAAPASPTAAVPEPGALALFALGVLGLMRRRQSR